MKIEPYLGMYYFDSCIRRDIKKIIIEVWEHYPEHTEACIVAYLENYQRSDEIIKLAIHLLEELNYPYDYVRGELVETYCTDGNT